jgi:hypothetical protein
MNPKIKMALKVTAWIVVPLVVSIPFFAGMEIYKRRKKKKENAKKEGAEYNKKEE